MHDRCGVPQVWFGGKFADEIEVPRLVTVVEQSDTHFPLLSVRETLRFAQQCLCSTVRVSSWRRWCSDTWSLWTADSAVAVSAYVSL
jgi:ABC-type multidrug transport system ATPase subunit